ncbi:Glutathione S-transferase, domain-containing protein [Cladophialophora immunda]|nr:Glutathione S-transferase, domain-containing protein [Cladophialophora immunda]
MSTEKSKLTLARGWPEKGVYSWSPFVTKVEFRFRHAGLAYDVEAGSVKVAPKGKIPYVDLGPLQDEGHNGPSLLGDSTFIIQRLLSMARIQDLNGSLPEQSKLNDLALRALLEDKLYFYHMRERWIENFYIQREKALWSMPYPVRLLVGLLIYRGVTKTLHGQGVGRLTGEEVRSLKSEIWQSIDSVLNSRLRQAPGSDAPVWVLGGEQPTEADATLFGFIVSVLVSDSAPESKKIVKSFPSVVTYAERIHNCYFPEYEKWT